MQQPAVHPREVERLETLERCNVLDTLEQAEFDSLTAIASALTGCPIALVSLIDGERQWFKSRHGLAATETPRSVSFCGHAILASDAPFVVSDATLDPRFHDNPLVVGAPHVRHYTGIALRVGDAALPVGTLCVIDERPRTLLPEQIDLLQKLALHVERLLELRIRDAELAREVAVHQRREQKLRAILGAIEEGIVVQSRSGAFETFSPTAGRLLGLDADQMAGRAPLEPGWKVSNVDGSDVGANHLLDRALRTGEPVLGVVLHVQPPSGEERWLLANARPYAPDEAGVPSAVVLSLADITAARRDEMERRRAEQQLERFFDVALEPMMIRSLDWKTARFNAALLAVLGRSRDELLAGPFSDFIHPEDRAHVTAQLAALQEGSLSASFEARYRRRDGSYCTLSWRVALVCDIGSLIAVARDVTTERAREDELRRAMRAAEAAGHAKSEFLATMSHEIRTPMNGVLGLTELLLGTQLDDEQRGMLGSVRDSGQALLQVLNDILDWSRIEAGRMQLVSRAVDPARMLLDVTTVLRSEAAGKGLVVALETPPEPMRALGDPGRMRQILFNLIGNAIKFTERGRVDVRLSLDAPSPRFPHGSCRFAMQDSGIGIAPDALARLFERFSQVDASATRRRRGSGLGLAISRQLAEAMGGVIEVESRLGEGSTFTLILPCATVEEAASEPKNLLPPQASSPRQIRVLVAEDDPINQKVARGLVVREGHHVTIADNGRLAVEAFEQGPFDLILMDVQMPEMGGLEATRRIREIERQRGAGHVVIVALTASVLPEQVGACLTSGMDEVLAKPFAKAVLVGVIHRASQRKAWA